MLAAAMVCYSCSSLPLSVIGVLVKPLGAEFGWSRASVPSAILIVATGTMLVSAIVGHFVDIHGPRRVGLIGLALLVGATALLSSAGPSVGSWYLVWAVYAAIQPVAGNVVWVNAVVSRFQKNRGTALAVLLTMQALSYGFMPSFGVFVMSHYGWRPIFVIFAAFDLLVAWPLAWRFFYGASDLDQRRRRTAAPAISKLGSTPLLEVFRRRQFWQIGVGFALAPATVSTLFVHLQPILTDSGISSVQAATVVMILGPASILGRFGSGYLLDRFSPTAVAAGCLMIPAISYAILISTETSIPSAYACALFLGIASGAESDLLPFLVSRYFGLQIFSRVYGVLLGIFAIGYGLAPVAAGAVFDSSGSYRAIFAVMVTAVLAAVMSVATLGSPRSDARPEITPEAHHSVQVMK